ncbi:diacylglycerol/lipid kinase family protein [Catenulispora yoronensis]
MLRAALAARGEPPPRCYATTARDSGGEATRAALAAGARLVVVCGGDGTVSACAAVLAGTGVPMAVIPAGTGNLVAGNLGIPKDPAAAVEIALNGVDRPIDVGRMTEGVVVGMAGLGLDAAMVQDAPRSLKRRLGWPAYLVSLTRHLADRGFTIAVEVDGHSTQYRHVRAVVIGNLGALHGSLTLFPDAQADDGVLRVAILAPRSLFGWLVVATRLLRKRGRNGGSVQRLHGQRIFINGSRELRRESDGEALADGFGLDVVVEPAALMVRSDRNRDGG